MAENINSDVEAEEEEEEEEDSTIDVHHHKFVYKVQSVQSPDHSTMSFHMTSQNTSFSINNSSNVMKMTDATPPTTSAETTTDLCSTNQSLLPTTTTTTTTTELLASSVISSVQHDSPQPTAARSNIEQFSSVEAYQEVVNDESERDGEEAISITETIHQQLHASDDEQFSTEPPEPSLFNDDRIIIGLTHDGSVIVDGLSMKIIGQEMSVCSNEENTAVCRTMNANEGVAVSTLMSEILEDFNQTKCENDNAKCDCSNAIVTGLTAHGEFIIANSVDKCSPVATAHFASVIMGLTSTGQIINAGCTFNAIPESMQMKCAQTHQSDTNDQPTILTVIGNLTAKNEKIIIALAHSNFTNIST
ncbi:unnamed protein product [Litomosoides sigmodontis]|uniref:Uncharacterized protein n=1 Tax=Litomosoides sigmodontis TaxID=42156 RepID=A0A3P7JLP7_LITSI|nr:unnamed protein product [Litomosoides sigmodontis]